MSAMVVSDSRRASNSADQECRPWRRGDCAERRSCTGWDDSHFDTELDERTQSASTVELAKEYGFCSAVVVPIPPARDNSPRGMLCLGSSTPCYFAGGGIVTFKLVARSVAMALHEWWMSRLGKELIERCSMTDDDLQLLRLVVRGCTTKDISRTLGLKAHAIDHRFIRINEKLRARNRTASATLVSSHGLL